MGNDPSPPRLLQVGGETGVMHHSLPCAIGRLWCSALCDIASNCVERFAGGEIPGPSLLPVVGAAVRPLAPPALHPALPGTHVTGAQPTRANKRGHAATATSTSTSDDNHRGKEARGKAPVTAKVATVESMIALSAAAASPTAPSVPVKALVLQGPQLAYYLLDPDGLLRMHGLEKVAEFRKDSYTKARPCLLLQSKRMGYIGLRVALCDR